MSLTKKRKLCWDCGGEVPEDYKSCPFCGGSFSSADKQQNDTYFDGIYNFSQNVSQAQTESSQPKFEMPKKNGLNQVEEEISNQEQSRLEILSLLFLLPGISLILFSIGTFLFSHEGYLTLKYHSSYALFTFLLSSTLLYFGIRNYKKIQK